MTIITQALRRGLIAVGCTVCLLAPLSASAQGTSSGKIGFINTERILKESLPAKAAQQKLQSEFSQREKDLQASAARIKALSDKLEKNGPVMSDADRAAAQQQLADMNRDFQRKQREFGEDLNAKRNAALAQVLDQANKVVKQVAEQGNYDIIFQDAVYVNPRIDITDKVLKALDASAAK